MVNLIFTIFIVIMSISFMIIFVFDNPKKTGLIFKVKISEKIYNQINGGYILIVNGEVNSNINIDADQYEKYKIGDIIFIEKYISTIFKNPTYKIS